MITQLILFQNDEILTVRSTKTSSAITIKTSTQASQLRRHRKYLGRCRVKCQDQGKTHQHQASQQERSRTESLGIGRKLNLGKSRTHLSQGSSLVRGRDFALKLSDRDCTNEQSSSRRRETEFLEEEILEDEAGSGLRMCLTISQNAPRGRAGSRSEAPASSAEETAPSGHVVKTNQSIKERNGRFHSGQDELTAWGQQHLRSSENHSAHEKSKAQLNILGQTLCMESDALLIVCHSNLSVSLVDQRHPHHRSRRHILLRRCLVDTNKCRFHG